MIDEVAHEVRNPLTSIGGFARMEELHQKMLQTQKRFDMM